MASFAYVAREAASGNEVRNSVAAASAADAIESLLKRDLLVVSIEEVTGKRGRTHGGKVPLSDLVIFTRQLATMIDAGLAIVTSLQSLAKQTRSKAMRDTIRDICARVENGDSFSEALQRHPRIFNRMFVCMVAAGEKSGFLAAVLARLATYLEDTARLRRKVKSAMLYPAVVAVAAAVVTIVLLAKVVPVFGEIFTSFKATLPAPTLYLIKVSNFVRSYLLLFIVAAGAGVYGWLALLKTSIGRYIWDSRRIRLPVFGPIAHNICLARFTRTFASLVRSGVPILEVLQIVSQTSGNVVIENAAKTAANDIQGGQTVSTALARHPVFTDMIVRMVAAGEETGKVDEMLERVADYLDEEVETALSGLTALIEPILIIFLGVVVGGIVICMFLPIFKLPEIISGGR